MEKLIADWGEKAAGLRFMHAHSGGVYVIKMMSDANTQSSKIMFIK